MISHGAAHAGGRPPVGTGRAHAEWCAGGPYQAQLRRRNAGGPRTETERAALPRGACEWERADPPRARPARACPPRRRSDGGAGGGQHHPHKPGAGRPGQGAHSRRPDLGGEPRPAPAPPSCILALSLTAPGPPLSPRPLPPARPQMLVDDIGDVTITNDGATILKLLEVQHPAAKVRARVLLSPSLRPRALSSTLARRPCERGRLISRMRPPQNARLNAT